MIVHLCGAERRADLAVIPGGDWLSGLLRVRPVVLDTGPLTSDVIRSAKSGLPSQLNVAIRLGVLRGYAASHVWAEVPRVLAQRAVRAGVPHDVLERTWWHEYVPLIRFVDCTGLPVTDQAAALARRDPSDANTLVLAGLLAPVVIIAEDRDLVASGLAHEQWRDLYEVADVNTRERRAGAGRTPGPPSRFNGSGADQSRNRHPAHLR
jgi:predicted nucleic acid-binding protein